MSTPVFFQYDFEWGAAAGPLHYYRVESMGIPYSDNPIPIDDETVNTSSLSTVVTMVMARSLPEVCQKLSNAGFTFPVKRIWRLDPPALRSEWSESDTETNRRAVSVTEEFNEVAACQTLYINQDVDVEATATQYLVAEVEEVVPAVAIGGVLLQGTAPVSAIFNPSDEFLFRPHDGVVLGGAAGITSTIWHHDPEGGVGVGGDAPVDVEYVVGGTQGVVTLGGHAEATIFGTEEVDVTGEGTAEEEAQGVFQPISAAELSGSAVDTTNTLCCPTTATPIIIYMNHNLRHILNMSKFLERNDYILPESLPLTFNDKSQSWRSQLFYRGYGLNNDAIQIWQLFFEFGCVYPNYGIVDVDSTSWKFGTQVSVREIATGQISQTRLLLHFAKSLICQNESALNFGFTFNTTTAESDPLTSYPAIFYDGASLFKSSVWDQKLVSIEISSAQAVSTPTVTYPELMRPIREVRGGRPTSIV